MSGGVDISTADSIFNIRLPSNFVIGIILYISSFIVYLFIIPQLNFTRTFPILNGAVYSMVVLSGVIVFHERLAMQHVIGVILVLAGIVVLGFANTN